jgi:hypothetical protein
VAPIPHGCRLEGPYPKEISVSDGVIARVVLGIDCSLPPDLPPPPPPAPARLEVSSNTTGTALTETYFVRVLRDGLLVERKPFGVNNQLIFSALPEGPYDVYLDGADPCLVAGPNPKPLLLSAGQTSQLQFNVSCPHATGQLQVSTRGVGADFDLDGYTLHIGARSSWLPANGSESESLPPGRYSVGLSGLRRGCSIAGANPRDLEVKAGGWTRETVSTLFVVTCDRRWEFAFTAEGKTYFATGDWMDIAQSNGGWGAWSPDGATIALTCGESRLCLDRIAGWPAGTPANSPGDGDRQVQFNSSTPTAVAWDAGKRLAIAFIGCDEELICYPRGLEIFQLSSDGGGLLLPGRSVAAEGIEPMGALTWSPDGVSLAFTCWENGRLGVCAISPDAPGGNFRRLGNGVWEDRDPAWSPDGSEIVFTTTRFGGGPELALMNPDGTGVTRLGTGVAGFGPSWSPDGSQLVFVRACGTPFCTTGGIYLINRDGTGLIQVLATSHGIRSVHWRPRP